MRIKLTLTKVKQIFGNMSIQTKLIGTTVCLVFCSVFFLSVYFYQISANLIIEHSRKYILNTMGQISKNIDYNINTIEGILFDITTDKELQKDLKIINNQVLDAYEEAQLGISIKNKLISKTTKLDAVKAVFLISLDGTLFATKQDIYSKPIDLPSKEIFEAKGSNVWFNTNPNLGIIPIGKAVKSLVNQKKLGYIILYIDISYIQQVFKEISISTSDKIFLVNNNNNNLVVGDVDLASLPNDFIVRYKDRIGIHETKILDKKKQVCITPLEKVDWTLVSISDDERYSHEMIKLQRITIILFTGVLGLITGLSIIIARGLSKPIRKLAESMEQFSKGDFTVKADVMYHDEIGNLRKSFNKMVIDMEQLVHNVYEEKNLKQQAQIQALQMQINPHFLYNTLDTIHWLAVMHEANDVAAVSRSLGYLMRFSLKEEKLISLEEELDAVENYLCIQKYRHGEGLSIEVDVEEEALYEKIPKHIVLPMIENAIEHGFSDKRDVKNIKVIGKIDGDLIRIKVIDSGVGMTEETLESINNNTGNSKKDEDNRHMSIGINNVSRRIKLYYGETYGLSIRSKYGEGTSIEIVIPKL